MKKPTFVLHTTKGAASKWRSMEEIANIKPSDSPAQAIKPANPVKIGTLLCRHRHSFIDQGKVKDMRDNRVQVHITSVYLADRPTPKFTSKSNNIVWDALQNWYPCPKVSRK